MFGAKTSMVTWPKARFFTDVNGEVTAVTLTTIVGDRVHFRVENYNGLSASVTQITI
ncbi:MAG: hypothetical protein IPL32_20235 [Chloracidobacterium sp.]|nr:hypothetical protein [Chloracidobacterium sp.]